MACTYQVMMHSYPSMIRTCHGMVPTD